MEIPNDEGESNIDIKEQENENYPLRTMDIIDNISDKIEKRNQNKNKIKK